MSSHDGTLTIAEVAGILRVSARYVRELVENGYLISTAADTITVDMLWKLLNRSLANPRLQPLRRGLRKRDAWVRVMREHPSLHRRIVDHEFSPGTLGRLLQDAFIEAGLKKLS